MDRVQYIGYIFYEHQVHVDPTKIQVTHVWPSPTTLTVLQIFLGLANFYRKFVLGFSQITCALNQITKGGCKENLMWGLLQQQAFNYLK